MQNQRAALFDVDGLFTDSESLAQRVFIHTLASRGITISLKDSEFFAGLQDRVGYEKLKEQRSLDYNIDEILAVHTAAYEARLPQVQILPGAREIVRRCRGMGYKIGLVSGSTGKQIKVITDKAGISPYVDVVVSCDTVPVSKPAPDGYIRAAQELEVPKELCIGFEDTSSGIAAIKAAGMYAVGVRIGSQGRQDFEHADYIVATLRHVEENLLRRFPNVGRKTP